MSKSIKSFFDSSGGEKSNKKARTEKVQLQTEQTDLDDDTSRENNALISDDNTNDVDPNNFLPWNTLDESWKSKLSAECLKPYFIALQAFLNAEAKSQTIFPPRSQIFSALNLCPFDNVKVVVIGQDPYHGAGQAHGLAFSVQRGVAIPPSLKNMIKEAKNDPGLKMNNPGHGNLESWSTQGVLMLNNVLTVRKADANSHQKHGWEEFTDAVVRELSRKEGLVYLLWGKPAQIKCKNIDATKNTVITCSHPSPLGAHKTDQPFMGSRCFSRCNAALEAQGLTPIDWTIR